MELWAWLHVNLLLSSARQVQEQRALITVQELGHPGMHGEPQLGLEGRVDDFFVINRAASTEEIQAYRERRQYSAMPITTMVTP